MHCDIHEHVYLYVHGYVSLHVSTRTSVFMFICVYICTCLHIHVFMWLRWSLFHSTFCMKYAFMEMYHYAHLVYMHVHFIMPTYLLHLYLISIPMWVVIWLVYMYVCVSLVWCSLFLVASTTYYCNQGGYTAMIEAAYYGHKDIVEYLVSQGADKDIKNNVSTHLAHTHICM